MKGAQWGWEKLGMAEPERPTWFLLACRECGDGDMVMPFRSATERGKWAGAHTRGTGHDAWFVKDGYLSPAEFKAAVREHDQFAAAFKASQ